MLAAAAIRQKTHGFLRLRIWHATCRLRLECTPKFEFFIEPPDTNKEPSTPLRLITSHIALMNHRNHRRCHRLNLVQSWVVYIQGKQTHRGPRISRTWQRAVATPMRKPRCKQSHEPSRTVLGLTGHIHSRVQSCAIDTFARGGRPDRPCEPCRPSSSPIITSPIITSPQRAVRANTQQQLL